MERKWTPYYGARRNSRCYSLYLETENLDTLTSNSSNCSTCRTASCIASREESPAEKWFTYHGSNRSSRKFENTQKDLKQKKNVTTGKDNIGICVDHKPAGNEESVSNTNEKLRRSNSLSNRWRKHVTGTSYHLNEKNIRTSMGIDNSAFVPDDDFLVKSRHDISTKNSILVHSFAKLTSNDEKRKSSLSQFRGQERVPVRVPGLRCGVFEYPNG